MTATRTASTSVKALSLWQPWASLIAAGLKRIETRHWSTGYRGLLAIHAAKRPPDLRVLDALDEDELARLPADLPLGAVVCLVRVVDVVPSDDLMQRRSFRTSLESILGDYSPGRYGWVLELVKVADPPISARGAQGLWTWTRESESQPDPAPLTGNISSETQATTVANIRDLPAGWHDDPRYVYIGRRNASWGMSESKWHNPFRRATTRGTPIELFEQHLDDSPDLLAALPELRGKTLVCWCKPAGCHGDVLAARANTLTGNVASETQVAVSVHDGQIDDGQNQNVLECEAGASSGTRYNDVYPYWIGGWSKRQRSRKVHAFLAQVERVGGRVVEEFVMPMPGESGLWYTKLSIRADREAQQALYDYHLAHHLIALRKVADTRDEALHQGVLW